MKKLLFFLAFILILTSCQSKECNCLNEEKLETHEEKVETYEEKLENKLVQYVEETSVASEFFTSDYYKIGLYNINLYYLQAKYKIDISEFVNEKTGEPCDSGATGVYMFVHGINEDKSLEYELVPVLSCN